MLGTVLGARDTAVSKAQPNPCPRGAYILVGERINKICALSSTFEDAIRKDNEGKRWGE